MTRRRIVIALLLACLLLSACASQTDSGTGVFSLYYLTGDAGQEQVLTAVPMQQVEPEMDLGVVIDALATPPEGLGLRSATAGTALTGWAMADSLATLTFDGHYGALDALDRTLFNACVTLTLMQFENVANVAITWVGAEGEPQVYNSESFALYQDRGGVSETLITLYFGYADGRYLVPESQTLVVYESESIERFIIEELIRGPRDGEHLALLPAETQLLDVRTEKGVCYVDLSADFYLAVPAGAISQRLALYSMVNSLTGRSNIERVQFLCEGEPVAQYGLMTLSAPCTRDERVIRAEGGVHSYEDLTVYVQPSGLDGVVPFALMVQRGEYTTEEQLVAETLLQMETPQFCEPLFPDGTELVSIAVIGGVCTLDFNPAFLEAESAAALEACVRALTASLTELSSVDSIRVRVAGETVTDAPYDLNRAFTAADLGV